MASVRVGDDVADVVWMSFPACRIGDHVGDPWADGSVCLVIGAALDSEAPPHENGDVVWAVDVTWVSGVMADSSLLV